MLEDSNRDFRRVMRSMAVYLTLLDLGMRDFEKIRKKIYEYYGRTISDCYNHPEYLKTVLEEIYGHKAREIINTIEENLGKDSKSIWATNFIEKLNKKK